MLNRRGLLLGLGASVVAAPAIIRTIDLMPIKPVKLVKINYHIILPETKSIEESLFEANIRANNMDINSMYWQIYTPFSEGLENAHTS